MVTIREVARRARVSVGTVSNVLAGVGTVRPELRSRVVEAMRDLDYHPNQIARSLKTRTTRTLGTVIGDITNPFYPLLVRGAEDAALARDYLLLTLNTDESIERERSALAMLRARSVDGLLLVIAPGQEYSHIRSLLESRTRVVALDRLPEGLAIDSVCVDNCKGAEMCVYHLVSRGHRRIAILTGGARIQTSRARLDGYHKVLGESGIEPDPSLVKEGDNRLESGYRLTKEMMLASRPPSAIFASNAMMGFGALKAMQELGVRCPDDVALAVFDDVPFGDVIQPRLTVVSQPTYEMGRLGAELLIARIEDREKSPSPVRIELAPELIVRESTAARELS